MHLVLNAATTAINFSAADEDKEVALEQGTYDVRRICHPKYVESVCIVLDDSRDAHAPPGMLIGFDEVWLVNAIQTKALNALLVGG